MPNQISSHVTDHQTCPFHRIKPQSKGLIQKTMINIGLSSFLFGYVWVYFNAIDLQKIMIILDINIDYSLGQGLLTSFIGFSAAFGALFSSYFLKSFSRKGCFYAINILCIFATLSIQTRYFYLILVGRCLQGMYIGLVSSITPLYIKQFAPQLNGKYGLYHQFFIMSGMLMGFLFNYILLLIFKEPQNYWRVHFCLPILVCGFQMYRIYYKFNFETPRYLVAQNRIEQAQKLLLMIYKPQYVEIELQILKKAVKHNSPIEQMIKEEQKLDIELSQMGDNQTKLIKEKLLSLQNQQEVNKNKLDANRAFVQINKQSQDNPLPIFAAIHIAIFQQMVGAVAIISYGKQLVKDIYPQLYQTFPIILNSFGLMAVFLGMKMIKTLGRVQILQIGGSVITCCLIVVSINFLREENGNTYLICIAFIIMRLTFSATLGPCLWLYMAQIVRPNIVPYGAMCNWLAAGIYAFVFPIITQKLGNPGWIFVFNLFWTSVSLIINHFCLVQTKDCNEVVIRANYDRRYSELKLKWKRICG